MGVTSSMGRIVSVTFSLCTVFISVLLYPYIFNISSRSSSSSTLKNSNQTMAGVVNRDKCIFCRIADRKEKNEIYFEDDEIIVFEDIKPATKYHLLVIPKIHISDCKQLVPDQLRLLDRLKEVGNKVLEEKLAADSYPDPSNIKKLMGFHWPPFHSVAHLHLHVIAPSDQANFLARQIFRPNSLWFVTFDYVRERLISMGQKSSTS